MRCSDGLPFGWFRLWNAIFRSADFFETPAKNWYLILRVFTCSWAAGSQPATVFRNIERMTRSTTNPSNAQGLLPSAESRWSHDRAFLADKAQADLAPRELPLELAFLAGADLSSELMVDGVGATPRAIWSLDWLLSEGKIIEEAYYRALAIHLGCEYYSGDPPLAEFFRRCSKGLRCGVGLLEARAAGPRIVVAPPAQFVPRLIEATRSGSIRSGSFALASPRRFASLVRAYRGPDLLNVALDRLPASLTAREGMTGFIAGNEYQL